MLSHPLPTYKCMSGAVCCLSMLRRHFTFLSTQVAGMRWPFVGRDVCHTKAAGDAHHWCSSFQVLLLVVQIILPCHLCIESVCFSVTDIPSCGRAYQATIASRFGLKCCNVSVNRQNSHGWRHM